MNSEIQDTIDLIKRNFNIQVNIKDQGDDCYTILNQYGDEEFTGNMTETLGFLYGIQYTANLLKPKQSKRESSQREALHQVTHMAMRFFPIKNNIQVTKTLRQFLSKLPDADLHGLLDQLKNTENPNLQEYIRDLLYKRELEANQELDSNTH